MALAAAGLLAAGCADQTPTGVDTGLTPTEGPASSLSAASKVASVQLYPAPVSLKLNQSSSIVVIARNSSGGILSLSGRSVSWSSSNPGVAKVAPGVVTGAGGGSATLKVMVDGVPGTIPVKVAAPNAVAKIQVLSTTGTLGVGKTEPFGAAVKSASGIPMAGYKISWSSSNPHVARVDGLGNVTPLAPGKATITAKAGGVVGRKAISVVSKFALSTHVDVAKAVSSLDAGQRRQLFALSYNSWGKIVGYSAKWASSDPSVATVDGAGNVVTKNPGIVRITATTSSGQKGYAWVIVNQTY
jgi:uncharacterized protein YjdB